MIRGQMRPTRFRVSAGDLPPGLSLIASSGEILGTPTSAALGKNYLLAVTITGRGEIEPGPVRLQ